MGSPETAYSFGGGRFTGLGMSGGRGRLPCRRCPTSVNASRHFQPSGCFSSSSASAAQGVVNVLVAAGVQAILNFAPTVLDVPDGVWVNNVDLAVELENLSYFIR